MHLARALRSGPAWNARLTYERRRLRAQPRPPIFDGPVSREHGGPVRLFVGPMYGYKSLKWLERIEVVDALHEGYWEVRGYDVDAWVGRSNGRRDEPTS